MPLSFMQTPQRRCPAGPSGLTSSPGRWVLTRKNSYTPIITRLSMANRPFWWEIC